MTEAHEVTYVDNKATAQTSTFQHLKSEKIIYVCYRDHVLFNGDPLVMSPQTRETVGWLVFEADSYITISWDRLNEPPMLTSCDSKATGLVILRSDILELKVID